MIRSAGALLGLGTVQLGVDYGISNREGRTPLDEARRILEVAREEGVRLLDTAPLYGESEAVLGQALEEGLRDFEVVTKTPHFEGTDGAEAARALEASVARSRERLGLSQLGGLLMHRAEDLLGPSGEVLFARMEALKRRGWVARLGASVYDGAEIDALLERFPLELVQLPASVLDQRLWKSGHLAKLKARGIEVHARSAFLQGLIFLDPEQLPAHLGAAAPTLRAFHRFVAESGLTAGEAALGFARALPGVDVVVCGVNDHRQLRALCRGRPAPEGLEPFAIDDPRIVDPRRWSKESRA